MGFNTIKDTLKIIFRDYSQNHSPIFKYLNKSAELKKIDVITIYGTLFFLILGSITKGSKNIK